MKRPADRRRRGIVDRRFQVGLACRFLTAFVVLFLLGTIIVFAPPLAGIVTGSSQAEIEAASAELLLLHRRVWPAAAFVAAGLFVYALVASRRIAGPLFRINAVLRAILDGNPPERVRLREGDFFRETADLLDELARREAEGKGRRGARSPGEGTDPGEGGATGE